MIKKILRIITTALFFAIFASGGFTIGVIVFPILNIIYSKDEQKRIKAKLNSVHHSWRFIIYCLSKLHITRLKINNPDLIQVNSSIIIANHPSLLDVVYLISTFKNSSCIIKSSLSKNLFLHFLVKDVYIFNDESLDSIIEKSQKLLNLGVNIIIFPEGTRTVSGSPLRLHKSFILIAHKTSSNILPVKIYQSFPFLRKKQPWYEVGDRCCIYYFDILPYIKISDFKSDSTHNLILNVKKEVIKSLYSDSSKT